MLFPSHLLLGRTLAKRSPALANHPIRKWIFLLGNVVPDLIPLTYFMGFDSPRVMGGHCLPYSEPKISRKLKKGLSVGLHSAGDAFRLGLLTHYLADSFTYQHTTKQRVKHKEHENYEKKLKEILPKFLSVADQTEPASSPEYLKEARQQFQAIPPSPERDAEWIVRVCTAVFDAIASI